jgi:hypothetical protein
MKAIKDFLDTMNKAVAIAEGAQAAEGRAKAAQQAALNALGNAENARIAADKTKADAEAYVRSTYAEIDKIKAESQAKMATETRQHQAWIENAKGQVESASAVLEGINRDIGLKRAEHDKLAVEIARIRSMAEAAAKL